MWVWASVLVFGVGVGVFEMVRQVRASDFFSSLL